MHRLALCLELPAGSAPDWVELIPRAGFGDVITGRDGRAWLWDAQAQSDVLGAYVNRAVALVIDINHSTQQRAPVGDESPAAAWVENIELRDGALWGHVSWTDRGRRQVANREYRYLSPVFDYMPDTSRIVRLVSAGLTNTPNLRVQALNNEESPMKLSAAIALALGLAATATEDEGTAAIAKLKGERDTALNAEKAPSLDRFVPRSDYDAVIARAANAEGQIIRRDADAHAAAVDAAITDASKAGKITPASVDYHRASCSDAAGLDRFLAFVGAAPVIAPVSDLGTRKPEAGNTALNAEEERVIELTGIDRASYLKQRDARAAA